MWKFVENLHLFNLFKRHFHNTHRFLTQNPSSVNTFINGSHNIDSAVKVKGWVKSVRQYKEVAFVSISDGSCLRPLQVVLSPSLITSDLTYGSCIEVQGELVASKGGMQSVELNGDSVKVLGPCDTKKFPVKYKKTHPSDYLRQFLHLRPRATEFGALLRLRNVATHAMHRFYQENGFCQIQTPIITSNDCEGAGEVFQVEPSSEAIENSSDKETMKNFFNRPAFLTVSGQLHLEVVTGAFPKVYTFGPTFRAENSRGRHHLSEFYMVEAEMAFTETMEDIMQVVEECLKFTTRALREESSEDLEWFLKNVSPPDHQKVIENITEKHFHRISYSDAVDILQKHGSDFKFPVKWGNDLQKEHERFLVSHLGGVPVFVVDFPAEIKPFYARANDDTKTVAALDLLCSGVGEVCGASLREERLSVLEPRLRALGLAQSYDWYLDLRRFGSAPHGGFGIGFERYLQAVLGISNIKDTIPFPRSTHNCKM